MQAYDLMVPFDGIYTRRGMVGTRHHLLVDRAPVGIPAVDGANAPVVLDIPDFPLRRRRHRIEWRDWREAYRRPLIDDWGCPIRLSAADFAEANPRHEVRCWDDHPFGLRFVERLFPGLDARTIPCEDVEFATWGTLRRSGRALAVAEANRLVGTTLAEIDGILHRRAALPVWSFRAGVDHGSFDHAIELVLPGLPLPRPSLGFMPVDLLAEAVAWAGEITSRLHPCQRKELNRAEGGTPGPIHCPVPLRREGFLASSLLQARDVAERCMSDHKVGRLDRPTVAAYGTMLATMARVDREGRRIGLKDLADARTAFVTFAGMRDVVSDMHLAAATLERTCQVLDRPTSEDGIQVSLAASS